MSTLYDLFEGGIEFGAHEAQAAWEPSEDPAQPELRHNSLARGGKRRKVGGISNQIEKLGASSKVADKYRGGGAACEDITGTGSIAITPGYQPIQAAPGSHKKKRTPVRGKSEKDMAQRRLNEELKGVGHKMDRVGGGEGVTGSHTDKETIGKHETELRSVGKEWPRKHTKNLAMGEFGDSQDSEHEYEGAAASPEDGYTTNTGKSWPRKQKNTGGNVELFGSDHPGELDGYKPGPVPKTGSKVEEWSITKTANLLESDTLDRSDLQSLFDKYARESVYNNDPVTLEGFIAICRANGAHNVLDEGLFLNLLDENSEFIFREYSDNSVQCWIAESAEPKAKAKHKKHDKKSKKKTKKMPAFLQKKIKAKSESYSKSQHDTVVREWISVVNKIESLVKESKINNGVAQRALQASFNIRLDSNNVRKCSPQLAESIGNVARKYGLSFDRNIVEHKILSEMRDEDGLGDMPLYDQDHLEDHEDEFGADYHGLKPKFGHEDLAGEPGNEPLDPAFDDEGGEPGELNYQQGTYDSNEIPDYREEDPADLASDSIDNDFYDEDPKDLRGKNLDYEGIGESRRKSSKRTISENLGGNGYKPDRVGGGKPIGQSFAKKSEQLPDVDSELDEIHGENLLGAKLKNIGGANDTFEHGGEGILKGYQTVKENVIKLAKSLKSKLYESINSKGKFNLDVRVLVADSKGNAFKAPRRATLGESLADAEELLVMYGPKRVALEATFKASNGQVFDRKIVNLPALAKRTPIMSEGKALFRFKSTADAYSGKIVNEGRVTRVGRHNWGFMVESSRSTRAINENWRNGIHEVEFEYEWEPDTYYARFNVYATVEAGSRASWSEPGYDSTADVDSVVLIEIQMVGEDGHLHPTKITPELKERVESEFMNAISNDEMLREQIQSVAFDAADPGEPEPYDYDR